MIDKIVLTGAPGSRKSSTIRILEYNWGELTIAEAAEDMIKTLRKQGYEKPWEIQDFQDRILNLQIQREGKLEQLEGRVFIDRGILDGLAYYQLQGKNPTQAMQEAIEKTKRRYSQVFLMERERGRVGKNGIRFESETEAQHLEELQYQNYANAGYRVERVPWVNPEERARRIIEILKELKGGERK